jgi:hypothetical protein
MHVNTKTFVLSFLAAFAVMFALSLLFYALILGDTISERIDAAFLREPPGYCCITLGYVALAVLMAWVYPNYRVGDGPVWKRGLRFGVIMGLLWIFPLSLVLHGVYNLPFTIVVIDTLWALVEQGIGGIVIAAIHQRAARSPSASAEPGQPSTSDQGAGS